MSGAYKYSPQHVQHQLGASPDSYAAEEGKMANELTFEHFSKVNRRRCEAPDGFNHKLESWSTSDWFLALFGELGEAANIAKKLNRVRDGIPGNKEKKEALQTKLRQELGDAFVYLDLLAQSLGVAISEAAVEVFNVKSQELGCQIVFALAAPAPDVPAQEVLCGTAGNALISMNEATLPTAKIAPPSEEVLLPDAEWKILSPDSQHKLQTWFRLATERLQLILDEPPNPSSGQAEALREALKLLERDWPPIPKNGSQADWALWAFAVDQMERQGLAALRAALAAAASKETK